METKLGKIFSLIPKIAGEIGPITKDRKNDSQGYRFRGIEDFLNAVHPILVKYGVFFSPEVIECQTLEGQTQKGTQTFRVIIRVKFKFYADDGSFVEATTQGEGIDTSDKASNKAMSAATKYCLINLFSIPTGDIEDSDRTSPKAGKTKHKINQVTKVDNFF